MKVGGVTNASSGMGVGLWKVGGATIIVAAGGETEAAEEMRPPKCCIYGLAANLLATSVWILAWEQLKLAELGTTSCGSGGQVRASLDGEVSRPGNGSEPDGLQVPVAASKRPLLVRFDWYSSQRTPVHMG